MDVMIELFTIKNNGIHLLIDKPFDKLFCYVLYDENFIQSINIFNKEVIVRNESDNRLYINSFMLKESIYNDLSITRENMSSTFQIDTNILKASVETTIKHQILSDNLFNIDNVMKKFQKFNRFININNNILTEKFIFEDWFEYFRLFADAFITMLVAIEESNNEEIYNLQESYHAKLATYRKMINENKDIGLTLCTKDLFLDSELLLKHILLYNPFLALLFNFHIEQRIENILKDLLEFFDISYNYISKNMKITTPKISQDWVPSIRLDFMPDIIQSFLKRLLEIKRHDLYNLMLTGIIYLVPKSHNSDFEFRYSFSYME
ncbi:unnamed protein product, partial [Didymodactylos carnosus]